MIQQTRLILMIVSIVGGLISPAAVNAQGTKCFTRESLQGSWATVVTYGSTLGVALAQGTVDADGKLNRTYVQNFPNAESATGERRILTGVNVGTIDVKCDGTGIITRVTTSSTGNVSNQIDDFLITGSIEKDGKLIATQFTDAAKVPSSALPGGVFFSRIHTRLPDLKQGQCYTNDSLQGNYAVTVQYDANLAMGLQPENLDGEGNLFRTGINNQPLAGSQTGERTIGNVTSRGTYEVKCNGTGTITRVVTRPDGTTGTAIDDFVITGAAERNGKLIATSIFDAQRTPAVVGRVSSLVTRTHVLRANASAELENQLQSLACGTLPPTDSCKVTINIWNYYLMNIVNPKAAPLVFGDGGEVMTLRRYLGARIAAGI